MSVVFHLFSLCVAHCSKLEATRIKPAAQFTRHFERTQHFFLALYGRAALAPLNITIIIITIPQINQTYISFKVNVYCAELSARLKVLKGWRFQWMQYLALTTRTRPCAKRGMCGQTDEDPLFSNQTWFRACAVDFFTGINSCKYLCVISLKSSREAVSRVWLRDADYTDCNELPMPACYRRRSRLSVNITAYDIGVVSPTFVRPAQASKQINGPASPRTLFRVSST